MFIFKMVSSLQNCILKYPLFAFNSCSLFPISQKNFYFTFKFECILIYYAYENIHPKQLNFINYEMKQLALLRLLINLVAKEIYYANTVLDRFCF